MNRLLLFSLVFVSTMYGNSFKCDFGEGKFVIEFENISGSYAIDNKSGDAYKIENGTNNLNQKFKMLIRGNVVVQIFTKSTLYYNINFYGANLFLYKNLVLDKRYKGGCFYTDDLKNVKEIK